jgi:hypothetical protein
MWMKKLIFLLSGWLISNIISAQFERPVIVFDSQEYDFGKIMEKDGEVSTEFEFTNSGKVPLILQNVQASCGCTTPEWPKEPLMPGQQGKITVAFNPKNRPGPFTKTITVNSNADHPVQILTIKGIVVPEDKNSLVNSLGYKYEIGDLRLSTIYVSFGEIFMGNTSTATIDLINASPDKTIRPGFMNMPDYISVVISPEVLLPYEMGQITITYSSAGKNDWDYVADRLFLTLNGELVPKNVISLTAIIKEDFSKLSPQELANAPAVAFDTVTYDFGKISASKKVEHNFIISNEGKSDLLIRKVNASCGCTVVQPAKNKISPGESTEIKVVYNAQGRSGADKKAITVVTNDPKQPKAYLWIKAFVENQTSQSEQP